MSHHDLIKKLTEKLENWDYQLDRLKARLGDYEEEARDAAEKAIEKLKSQNGDLQVKLKRLEKAGEAALDDIQTGLEIAADGIKLALLSVESEFIDDDKKK